MLHLCLSSRVELRCARALIGAIGAIGAIGVIQSPTAAATVSTARSVSATAICDSEFCQEENTYTVSTDAPGPWFFGLGSSVVGASAGALQDTVVSPSLMAGAGEAFGSGGESFGSWHGESKLDVTFTLQSLTPFTLSGSLAADGNGSIRGAASPVAAVQLVGPEGMVFSFEAAGSIVGGEVVTIDESGDLPAGTYTISFSAIVDGIGSEVSFGDASSSFNVSFFACDVNATCGADLNGDGAVDATDLAQLLGNWDSDGGAGDIDCGGQVDAADLADLLAQWGPCAP